MSPSLAFSLCFPSLVSLSLGLCLYYCLSLLVSLCLSPSHSVCMCLCLCFSIPVSHFLSFSLWHLLFSFIPIHLSTPHSLVPISNSSEPLTHQLLPDPQQTLPGTSSVSPWGREGLTHLLRWGDSPQGPRGWAQPWGHQSSLPQLLPELHSLRTAAARNRK